MKKIYITNDFYQIAKTVENYIVVEVSYLFKGNDCKKFYAYELEKNKLDEYYLDLAKQDFHKFKKTKKSICYSRCYLFKESSTPKRRCIIGSLQALLIIGVIATIIALIIPK